MKNQPTYRLSSGARKSAQFLDQDLVVPLGMILARVRLEFIILATIITSIAEPQLKRIPVLVTSAILDSPPPR